MDNALKLLQALLNATQQSFVLLDTQGRVLAFNRVAEQEVQMVLGVKLHVGDVLQDTAHTNDLAAFENNLNLAVRGQTVHTERLFIGANGQEHWFAVHYIPAYDAEGELVGVVFNSLDITSHKQAEAALRNSLARQNALFEHAHDAIILSDPRTGLILDVNAQAEALLGYARGALVGQPQNMLYPPNRRTEFRRLFDASQPTTSNLLEAEVQTAENRRIPVEVSVSLVQMPDAQWVLQGIFRDITERKHMLEALRESQARWQFALEGSGDGVWDWNAHTNEVFFSRQWKAMLGFAENEVGNTLDEWEKRVHPDDLPEVLREINQHFAGQTPVYVSEHRVLCKDGSYKWVLDRGQVVSRTADNQPLRVVGTRTDITERKHMEAALRRWAHAFEHAEWGICLTSSDGLTLLDLNPAFARLHGYSVEALRGQPVAQLYPPDLQAAVPGFVQRAQAKGNYTWETVCRRQDGSTFPALINMTTVRDANHSVVYHVVNVQDITSQKQAERQATLRIRWLEQAAQRTLEALMALTLDDIHRWLGVQHAMFYLLDEQATYPAIQHSWATPTLPNQQPPLLALWEECAVANAPIKHRPALDITPETWFVLALPACRLGKTVAVLQVARQALDFTAAEQTLFTHLVDMLWELVSRKQTEERLQESQARLRLLGDNMDFAGLYVYAHLPDGTPRFEYLSAHMATQTGVPVEEGLQNAAAIHNTILPEYRAQLQALEAHSKANLSHFEMELRQRHAQTGVVNWVLMRSTPRRRADGSTVWYGVQININERKHNEQMLQEAYAQLRLRLEEIERLQDDLRNQAMHDPLTGLYNRRYLVDTLAREIARAQRDWVPLSVLVCDIDFFKRINDTYGHQMGDQYLLAVASLLNANARASDVVCRYGGEEFVLVLPGAALGDAAKRAEELRLKCAALVVPPSEHTITLSVGIATYPMHGQNAATLINHADRALYHAKHTGRNRVVVWDDHLSQAMPLNALG